MKSVIFLKTGKASEAPDFPSSTSTVTIYVFSFLRQYPVNQQLFPPLSLPVSAVPVFPHTGME